MQFVEYRYHEPIEFDTSLAEEHRTLYEHLPTLVKDLHLFYNSCGLLLAEMLLKNYSHKHLRQIAQINFNVLPMDSSNEGAITEFLTLSSKTCELKYSTHDIFGSEKFLPPLPIATVTNTGIIRPYSLGIDTPIEKRDASYDFIRALKENTDLNDSLTLALTTFTVPQMLGSIITVKARSLDKVFPSYQATMTNNNNETTTGLILPYHL